jgi:adenylyltransferase/sulfurtransferase
VQLRPPASGEPVSLNALEEKLAGIGKVTRNKFLLRLAVEDCEITVFPDGRTIIAGTDDVSTARSLQAKYLGS